MKKLFTFRSLKRNFRHYAAAAIVMVSGMFSAQQTYTFTNAGAVGAVGPTQSQVSTAYASTNLNNSVTVSGQGVQLFTVPLTGDYEIVAVGASGYGQFGGRGAEIRGEFQLTAGQTLKIVVGQQGLLGPNTLNNDQYGGGGGSFVSDASNNPLVVAGGGGASWASAFSTVSDALTTNNGNGGANGVNVGAAGSNGNGGSTGNGADGGGGFSGDGGGTAGGFAFTNGSGGGNSVAEGGFGGGGGVSNGLSISKGATPRCGGGGGYSGGGGATGDINNMFPVGGGGGSYNAGTNQVNVAGQNVGDGYVLIKRLCDVDLTATKNPICEGESVTLSTNAGSNILWNTGATSNSIIVTPGKDSVFVVSGVSSSSTACSATLAITVSVNPMPVLHLSSSPSVVCVGSTATLAVAGANSYLWNTAETDAEIVVSPQSTTIYTVLGTDHNNCTRQATVTANVNSNSLVIVPSSFNLCAGSTETITASGALQGTYMWSTGSAFPEIVVSPLASTVFVVQGVDAHNCKISSSVPVTVLPLPSISLAASNTIICMNEIVELTAGGAIQYQWGSGETTAVVSKMLPIDLTYTFQVTGIDENGCTGTATLAVTAERCTGLGELSSALSLEVSPNPSAGKFQLRFSSEADKQLTLTDVTGKVLLTKTVHGEANEIDLQAFSAGIYYLIANDGNEQQVKKLIRE